MADLADQGLYIGLDSSFYLVFHQAALCHRRGRDRLPQETRSVPRLRAYRPNAVWSLDITYLPTTECGIWLYLYLVIDVWSSMVVFGMWSRWSRLSSRLICCSGSASRSPTAALRVWQ